MIINTSHILQLVKETAQRHSGKLMVAAGIGGTLYGTTQVGKFNYVIATGSTSGMITTMEEGGVIWPTSEMGIQQGIPSQNAPSREIGMSLCGDPELKRKAEEAHRARALVRVGYSLYFYPQPSIGSSNFRVTSIEPVEPEQEKPNASMGHK